MKEPVGTELKRLLAGWPFYITASESCSCNSLADAMDALGADWCEADSGMRQILLHMKTNASDRGMPFVELVARLLLKRAIRNARKAESKRTKADV